MSAAQVDVNNLAGMYLAMAQLFTYPNAESVRRLAEHGLIDRELTPEVLGAEYLAAFEVGRDGPPVPLFESMHRGDMGRDGILEDLMRYYEYFDAKLSETDREYPDHLVTELEFLAWLCMQERTTVQKRDIADSFRRAQRDFLDRHLAAWLPTFRRRLEETDTAYGSYGTALAELVEAHRGRLVSASLDSGNAR